MAFVKVVGVFDDSAAVEQTIDALLDAGLVNGDLIRVEAGLPSATRRAERVRQGLLERAKAQLHPPPVDVAAMIPDDVPPGAILLLATVVDHDAPAAQQIMQRHGAMQTRTAVDPLAPPVVEEADGPQVCVDDAQDPRIGSDDPNRTVRLFDEATGREIGRISEVELDVLQNALEEEGPDDNDFWINPDTVDMLACRPGATPHLIAVLRAAVGENEEGIDIAFQREGQPLRSLRGMHGSTHTEGHG